MQAYLVQRLLLVVPTLLGVSILVFALVRVLPGDAVAMLLQDYAQGADGDALRAQLGLDRPAPVQYVEWLGPGVPGDLGTAPRRKTPLGAGLASRIPRT